MAHISEGKASSEENRSSSMCCFLWKPFYISRVAAIVQRRRVTSNTRILLNLMLGNMSKSLTQSCQRHYYLKSDSKYPCASSADTHTNVHLPNYHRKNCFWSRQCCCFTLNAEKNIVAVTFFLFYKLAEHFWESHPIFTLHTSVSGGEWRRGG